VKRTWLLPTLCLAALAAPGPAFASDVVGSDLQQTHEPQTIECDTYPCTLAQQSFEGYVHAYLPGGGVITRWSARLAPGSSARLRVLRENAFDYTSVAQSAPGTAGAAGGVATFNTRIPLEPGGHVIGMDLISGSIATDAHADDDGTRTVFWQPVLAAGATRADDGGFGHELMLNATVEPDDDGDGYGDETQDACVFCQSGGGGGDDTGGGGAAPPPSGPADSPAAKKGPRLTIDRRAILRAGPAGREGWVAVYVTNDGDQNAKGTIAIRSGRKTVWRQKAEVDWADTEEWGNFRLRRAQLRTLHRRGKLEFTSVASWRDASGKKRTVKQPLTVILGGAKGYDGYYKGPGPLVISVERGVLTAINIELNTFCIARKQHMLRSLFTVDGFPTLIKRDGSFSAKGHAGSDQVKYRGRFRRNGTGAGYLSLFHTEMWIGDGGRFQTDTCYDARNWKVKRTR
jgi:hypothetical protein